MSRRRSAFLLALAALGLPGCGSAGLSSVQLRARAGAICERSNRQLEAIGAPQSASAARSFLQSGAAALASEHAELDSLDASGEAGHVYRAAVSDLGAELAAIQSTVRNLGHGADAVTALRALSQRLTPLETHADDAWRALQIPACLQR